jgi:GNAT superfamily N-acetyltransferase
MPVNSKGQGLDVRVAASDDERLSIYQFRYRTLVREMGWGSRHADHDREVIRDSLDETAKQLYVSRDGVVIAALRLILDAPENVPDGLNKALAIDRFGSFPPLAISLSDRLMVAPAWQRSQVSSVLLGAGFKTARRHGSRFDISYCPPAMLELYEQLGYRRYADNISTDDGYRVPLVLLTEDIRHLREINSPFAPLAEAAGGNDPESAGWFNQSFADYASRPSRRRMNEERFWHFLTAKLHQTPNVGIPLLAGLDYEEAKHFLSQATVIVCNDGDPVVRAGEPGREMYVVLSGGVTVSAAGGEQMMARLGRGAVFGEMALLSAEPRTADVTAHGITELLMLSEEFLHSTMTKMPRVSAKVLFALSLILCQRLRKANERWIEAEGDSAPALPHIDSGPPDADLMLAI